jgi:RimJ/RimL family protein N-acetyltransferase
MKFGEVIKTFKSDKGNSVVFRYPKKSDLDDMLAFANSLIEEDTFVMLSGKRLTREEEVKHLNETLEDMQKGKKIHIAVEVNGRYAGNGVIRIGILRHSHVGDVGISLTREFRDDGIGTELLKTLISEGRTAGLRLLTINCFENNARALHLYEKVGFIRAGVIPGEVSYKGKYYGEIKLYLPL